MEQNTMPVPAGHKQILVRVEFDNSIMEQVTKSVSEVVEIKSIDSDNDVEEANKRLKKAKALIKLIEQQRQLMTVELDNEKKQLINLERTLTDPIEAAVKHANALILHYQNEQFKKKEEARKAIEEEKRKQLEAAQAEANRVKNIKNIIDSFKLNGYQACHTATIETIDSFIQKMESANYTAETFQEFLPDMQALHLELYGAFKKRKIELEQLAQVEKINAEAAAKLKAEQEAAAEAEKLRLQEEAQVKQYEQAEQLENTIANIQMTSEFKEANVNKLPPGARRVWTFDEDNIDLEKLPLEFHTYDKKKIKAAISEGAREIPGLIIKQEIQNVSR